MTSYQINFLGLFQYKCWIIIASVWSIPVRRRCVWYQFTTYFRIFCGINILFLQAIILWIIFHPPQKEPPFYVSPLIFSVRKGYFRWYHYMILKVIEKYPLGNSFISKRSCIVSIYLLDSYEFFLFQLLGNFKSASATIFYHLVCILSLDYTLKF